MVNKEAKGRYLVITILFLAVAFSLALSFSVDSLIKKMKAGEQAQEEPGPHPETLPAER